uniref:Zgc:165604 n=1 Tax=Scleropages formosus TaxID=113540 RepID=A0A8C9SHS7_SCLFO
MGYTAGLLLRTACLLSSVLEHAGTLRVTMRTHSLEVVQGDAVILPCSFFTMSPLSRLNIVWTLTPFSDPRSPKQVIAYDHGQVIEDPALIGRVGFVDVPWRADVVLNNTRVSDAGTYRCVVSNPPEAGDPGIGQLSLSVLAPPSLPMCLWDGDTVVGSSVTLTCVVEQSVPVPEIQWNKLEPEQIPLPVNMLGDLKGTVSIHNVSAQNSGLYRCSVSNHLGIQNCYISLNVYSGKCVLGSFRHIGVFIHCLPVQLYHVTSIRSAHFQRCKHFQVKLFFIWLHWPVFQNVSVQVKMICSSTLCL